ncbi:MAG: LysM peptidoglycan-binding domain-containing protein [Clostridia bacterium]
MGVTIKSIVELNDIANPNLIYVGETLRIPTINS